MNSEFFAGNRRNLVKALNGGLVVIGAYTSLQSQNDMAHEFTQEANFWYLTGIDQPGWKLIIDGARAHSWLVSPTISKTRQIFDGSLSVEEAQKMSGVDEIIAMDEFEPLLRRLAQSHPLVHSIGADPMRKYYDFVVNPAINSNYKLCERVFKDVRDCRREIVTLRAIKQESEIKQIEQAVKSTIEAFDTVRGGWDKLRYEYEVEAEFTYLFRKKNLKHAYSPIVASGKNACTLHYVDSDSKIQKRALTVIDIGALVGRYPADITRTYSSYPTKRQQEVYDKLSQAQWRIINLIRPGVSLVDYYKNADDIMKNTLAELSLLDDLEDTDTYRKYFPHAIGHGLGVDVHEGFGEYREFRPGMVLTVEPGVYIVEESIGVRLEDDILVTDDGNRNLSANLSLEL